MTEDSANKNLMSPLRVVGLIDHEGRPTDRAFKWRDDAQYPEACKEIVEEVYPEELRDAFPSSESDRAALQRWFAARARVGEGAASQMASLYLLLLEADPANQDATTTPTAAAGSNRSTAKVGTRRTRSSQREESLSTKADDSTRQNVPARDDASPRNGPPLHMDIHIHISPESSADQIDSIFASMAKHLYKSG